MEESRDVDASCLYSMMSKDHCDGRGDALDFINIIEQHNCSIRLVYAVDSTIYDYHDMVGVQGAIFEIFLSIFNEGQLQMANCT